jgi:hypothetical protein
VREKAFEGFAYVEHTFRDENDLIGIGFMGKSYFGSVVIFIRYLILVNFEGLYCISMT